MRLSLKFLESLISVFKDKKSRAIWLLLALGLLLVILSSALAGDGESAATDSGESQTLEEYGAMLEQRLAESCSSVEGVGKCKVIVTFSKGAEKTYKSGAVTQSRPPEVMGITVICRGGGSESVKRDLTDMLSALFGIVKNRIAVLKLNS